MKYCITSEHNPNGKLMMSCCVEAVAFEMRGIFSKHVQQNSIVLQSCDMSQWRWVSVASDDLFRMFDEGSYSVFKKGCLFTLQQELYSKLYLIQVTDIRPAKFSRKSYHYIFLISNHHNFICVMSKK